MTEARSTLRGDELLARVLDGGDDDAAMELLDELFRGYPVERLRRLLESENEQAAKAGAWLASELGERVAPLAGDLARLLEHAAAYVRHFALLSVLVGTTAEHGSTIARGIGLVCDPDFAVRFEAMRLLSRGTEAQLTAAVADLGDGRPATLLDWLLSLTPGAQARSQIVARLADDDPVTQRFAVAAAARMNEVGEVDTALLEEAASSSNPDVRSFATQELEILQIGRRRRQE